MTLWLNRAGRHGEFETRFLDGNRIYCTWENLTHDLGKVADKAALLEFMQTVYPGKSVASLTNHRGQVWAFSHEMEVGDWVVLPSQLKKAAIHIAEITGPYAYDPKAEDPYYHSRTVKWLATDIPRSNFEQDLLYSLGAAMTICRITRNDAEARVRAMQSNGWKPSKTTVSGVITDGSDDGQDGIDLEQLARDQIAKVIIRQYKGHGMALLVESTLQAQGYTTYRSPEGPDKGIDILAATGPLGFGQPRICVQVKSGDSPVDRPTLDQLIGAMQNVQADQGLLVSWGGFKSSVDKETAQHFFRVRLWDQNALIEELLEHYDGLDEDVRTSLPLKRIWTVAVSDEEA